MIRQPFGTLPSGLPVESFRLENAAGASLEVLTYGGIVKSLRMPDRNGTLGDVVLGFNDLADYAAGHPYFGAITGRIAGRVAGGQIVVEGRAYSLPLNSGDNHIHGGFVGFDRRIWTPRPVARSDGADSLQLTYESPDGEENYPGNVKVAVTYTLTADHTFVVETVASTDRTTPLCLAHHSYFNLGGEGSGPATDHVIQIAANEFVRCDDALLLSGERISVAGCPEDFRQPRRLGDALPYLFQAHGDFYPLRAPAAPPPSSPTLAARATHSASGRVLDVFTDEDCLQFYTGSALDEQRPGKWGRRYGPYAGLCFECQGHPEGTRVSGFGDILVRPGQPQRRTTRYAFSTV